MIILNLSQQKKKILNYFCFSKNKVGKFSKFVDVPYVRAFGPKFGGKKPFLAENRFCQITNIFLPYGIKGKSETSFLAKEKSFYTSYSKLSEVKLLTIGIASPLRILQWAEKTLPNGKIYGEVLNANTLHHKTFKPQKGGLFCERIFGPLKDFECACGKTDKSIKFEFRTVLQKPNSSSLKETLPSASFPSLPTGREGREGKAPLSSKISEKSDGSLFSGSEPSEPSALLTGDPFSVKTMPSALLPKAEGNVAFGSSTSESEDPSTESRFRQGLMGASASKRESNEQIPSFRKTQGSLLWVSTSDKTEEKNQNASVSTGLVPLRLADEVSSVPGDSLQLFQGKDGKEGSSLTTKFIPESRVETEREPSASVHSSLPLGGRKFCPDCDVEYTWSVIRRYQLGYIKLNSPVAHIWFLRGTPSYVSILLDIRKRYLQYITYSSETLTIENSLNNKGTILDSPAKIFESWKNIVFSSPSVPSRPTGREGRESFPSPKVPSLREGRDAHFHKGRDPTAKISLLNIKSSTNSGSVVRNNSGTGTAAVEEGKDLKTKTLLYEGRQNLEKNALPLSRDQEKDVTSLSHSNSLHFSFKEKRVKRRQFNIRLVTLIKAGGTFGNFGSASLPFPEGNEGEGSKTLKKSVSSLKTGVLRFSADAEGTHFQRPFVKSESFENSTFSPSLSLIRSNITSLANSPSVNLPLPSLPTGREGWIDDNFESRSKRKLATSGSQSRVTILEESLSKASIILSALQISIYYESLMSCNLRRESLLLLPTSSTSTFGTFGTESLAEDLSKNQSVLFAEHMSFGQFKEALPRRDKKRSLSFGTGGIEEIDSLPSLPTGREGREGNKLSKNSPLSSLEDPLNQNNKISIKGNSLGFLSVAFAERKALQEEISKKLPIDLYILNSLERKLHKPFLIFSINKTWQYIYKKAYKNALNKLANTNRPLLSQTKKISFLEALAQKIKSLCSNNLKKTVRKGVPTTGKGASPLPAGTKILLPSVPSILSVPSALSAAGSRRGTKRIPLKAKAGRVTLENLSSKKIASISNEKQKSLSSYAFVVSDGKGDLKYTEESSVLYEGKGNKLKKKTSPKAQLRSHYFMFTYKKWKNIFHKYSTQKLGLLLKTLKKYYGSIVLLSLLNRKPFEEANICCLLERNKHTPFHDSSNERNLSLNHATSIKFKQSDSQLIFNKFGLNTDLIEKFLTKALLRPLLLNKYATILPSSLMHSKWTSVNGNVNGNANGSASYSSLFPFPKGTDLLRLGGRHVSVLGNGFPLQFLNKDGSSLPSFHLADGFWKKGQVNNKSAWNSSFRTAVGIGGKYLTIESLRARLLSKLITPKGAASSEGRDSSDMKKERALRPIPFGKQKASNVSSSGSGTARIGEKTDLSGVLQLYKNLSVNGLLENSSTRLPQETGVICFEKFSVYASYVRTLVGNQTFIKNKKEGIFQTEHLQNSVDEYAKSIMSVPSVPIHPLPLPQLVDILYKNAAKTAFGIGAFGTFGKEKKRVSSLLFGTKTENKFFPSSWKAAASCLPLQSNPAYGNGSGSLPTEREGVVGDSQSREGAGILEGKQKEKHVSGSGIDWLLSEERSVLSKNHQNQKANDFQANKVYNNVYTLSHRERWEGEKDWQVFSIFNTSLSNYNDVPIFTYRNRVLSVSENSFLLSESSLNTRHINTAGISFDYTLSSAFYSGPGMVQQLLNELSFSEMKKLDKQNRFVLYQLNKQILKSKKQVQVFVYDKTAQIELKELCKKRDFLIRRTKLVRKLFRNESNPSSMILTVIPVLPPDLRPIVKMGAPSGPGSGVGGKQQIAASDFNRLYQRVIYRNDRLKKFLKDPATSKSYEMKYAQRLLQEAVDNLMQNGKSGANSEKDARGRALKSLSDILKGKQGRFRQFLLGKRVDYSGRSVIVVGPKLKLHECGLPVEMAKELYLPFLLKAILNKNYAKTVIGAKTLMKNNASLAHELLREIMQVSPILLNRAPTLHRLGIQAFVPKLIEGRAILLHPLVCSAFNADFDGDQMAVHVPITVEARAEAWKLMLSRNNILSPATGDPLAIPSQDMVLGCYYLTTNSNNGNILPGSGMYFQNKQQVLKAYNSQKVHIHAIVWVKWSDHIENGNDQEEPIEIRVSNDGHWQEISSNYHRSIVPFRPSGGSPVSFLLQKEREGVFFSEVKGTVFYGESSPLGYSLVSQYVSTTPGRLLFNSVIHQIMQVSDS